MSVTDAATTVADLRDAVARFVSERDWGKFHNLKDLAISISIEAAELLEIFQWSGEDSRTQSDPDVRAKVADELSDVVIYCLSMANALDLDLSDHVLQKIRSNAKKYPVETYRGRYR